MLSKNLQMLKLLCRAVTRKVVKEAAAMGTSW